MAREVEFAGPLNEKRREKKDREAKNAKLPPYRNLSPEYPYKPYHEHEFKRISVPGSDTLSDTRFQRKREQLLKKWERKGYVPLTEEIENFEEIAKAVFGPYYKDPGDSIIDGSVLWLIHKTSIYMDWIDFKGDVSEAIAAKKELIENLNRERKSLYILEHLTDKLKWFSHTNVLDEYGTVTVSDGSGRVVRTIGKNRKLFVKKDDSDAYQVIFIKPSLHCVSFRVIKEVEEHLFPVSDRPEDKGGSSSKSKTKSKRTTPID